MGGEGRKVWGRKRKVRRGRKCGRRRKNEGNYGGGEGERIMCKCWGGGGERMRVSAGRRRNESMGGGGRMSPSVGEEEKG